MERQSVGHMLRRAIIWIPTASAAAAVFGVVLVAAVLLVMRHEHNTPITLPTPTGHFPVGRTTVVWTNVEQADELASVRGSKRQVVVWMWYPAMRSTTDTRANYLPPAWRAAVAQHQGMFMRSFFKRDPTLVRTQSREDAPLSADMSRYPVLVLRAGGSALTTDFTTLAEDLASHGYFVVGFDAPYRSFVVVLPDGRVIGRSPGYNVVNANGNLADPLIGRLLAMWTSDTRFIVTQLQRLNDDPSGAFSGRMDLDHLGMVGHSFGGATALEFCHEDSRCKAAVDLDGIPFGAVVEEGLVKPAMFLLSDHTREMSDSESQKILAEIQSIYDRLPSGRVYGVIHTANHFSFSDQILLNSYVAGRLLQFVGVGGLDGHLGLLIVADYVRTFFDVHLKGAPADSLARLAGKYPLVQVEPQ